MRYGNVWHPFRDVACFCFRLFEKKLRTMYYFSQVLCASSHPSTIMHNLGPMATEHAFKARCIPFQGYVSTSTPPPSPSHSSLFLHCPPTSSLGSFEVEPPFLFCVIAHPLSMQLNNGNMSVVNKQCKTYRSVQLSRPPTNQRFNHRVPFDQMPLPQTWTGSFISQSFSVFCSLFS